MVEFRIMRREKGKKWDHYPQLQESELGLIQESAGKNPMRYSAGEKMVLGQLVDF